MNRPITSRILVAVWRGVGPYPSRVAKSLPFPVRFKHVGKSATNKLIQSHRLPNIHLSSPEQLYGQARQLKRKIICHIGPTNSGKTFKALEALKNAKSGVYLGPLRLLAWEVSEKLNTIGVACNLVTGQELVEVAGAKHVSCTVEMANLSHAYDVAVIDEAQLIGDDKRGWAWTRALLGLQAQEIHICGSPSFLELIRQISRRLGESVHVCEYERLTPLEAQKNALASLKHLTPGDCVIAFSRRSCYQIKQKIEQMHKGRYKCCVVYGGLPPAARQEQARLFNTPNNGFDILVATDAVGMGLNLSIGRVIFSSLSKFDGKERRALQSDEIKQIGGRAGRYQSIYPNGRVLCMKPEDMDAMHKGFTTKDKRVTSAGLFPSIDELKTLEAFVKLKMDKGMVDEFCEWMGIDDVMAVERAHDYLHDFIEAHPKYSARLRNKKRTARNSEDRSADTVPLSVLFELFAEIALMDASGLYHLCDLDEVIAVAKCLDDIDMQFEDRYLFCMAPLNTDNPMVRRQFIRFARRFARGDLVPVGMRLSEETPTSHIELLEVESRFQVFDLYTWLAHRFPAQFDELEKASQLRDMCSDIIAQALATLGPKPPTLSQIGFRDRESARGAMIHNLSAWDDVEEEEGLDGLEDFADDPDESEDDEYGGVELQSRRRQSKVPTKPPTRRRLAS